MAAKPLIDCMAITAFRATRVIGYRPVTFAKRATRFDHVAGAAFFVRGISKQRKMATKMLLRGKDFQVGWVVVRLVFIAMVYVLGSFQWASQKLRHDGAMFKSDFPINIDVAIAGSLISSSLARRSVSLNHRIAVPFQPLVMNPAIAECVKGAFAKRATHRASMPSLTGEC